MKASGILDYLLEEKCTLAITGSRISKRGDFRALRGGRFLITINEDVNKYRFILTLAHEMAHLKTYLDHGPRVKPHGKEWKRAYKQVLMIWNFEEDFAESEELQKLFEREKEKPRAFSGIDLEREKVLRQFDETSDAPTLDEVPVGQRFIFKNVQYVKLENLRSRALCLNLRNRRKYAIHRASAVVPF